MDRALRRWLIAGISAAALAALPPGAASAATSWPPDTSTIAPGLAFPKLDEEAEQELLERDREFIAGRTAGDDPLDVRQAGAMRNRAARDAKQLGKTKPPAGPATFDGAWSAIGPAPIGEIARSSLSLAEMNGRIGALAVRPSGGQVILGGAQGGIWLYDEATQTWAPATDDEQTQAIGSLTQLDGSVTLPSSAIVQRGLWATSHGWPSGSQKTPE